MEQARGGVLERYDMPRAILSCHHERPQAIRRDLVFGLARKQDRTGGLHQNDVRCDSSKIIKVAPKLGPLEERVEYPEERIPVRNCSDR